MADPYTPTAISVFPTSDPSNHIHLFHKSEKFLRISENSSRKLEI